jgi:hypothetical protein
MDTSLLTVHPTTEANWFNENVRTEGLLLRDYFAAKCMSAVIGSLNGPVTGEEHPGDFEYYASTAYKMADAMLKAREA